LRLLRAEGTGIHDLLPNVLATVIPRPRTPYNDIALAIKLFDYLSYGRPLLVTDCTEQARIIRQADAGLVVGDSVDQLAQGIARLAAASPGQVDAWSERAHATALRESWTSRARQLVDVLEAVGT
jgi:glycosyltransferase involved in cell wall biosynthesis